MVAEDAEPGEATFVAELDEALSPIVERARRCPSPDLVRAAGEDVLPAHVATLVLRHIEGCAICRSLAADLAAIDPDGLSAVAGDHIRRRIEERAAPRPARSVPRRAWWLAAGAAAAASLIIAVVSNPGAVQNPAVPAPPALRVAAIARPSLLAVDKPALRLPVATLVSLRGTPDPRSKELMAGLERYNANDFRAAAEHLARVVPNASMPQLAVYLGVSYLQLGESRRAAELLSQARASAPGELVDDIDWYVAIAHVRTGDLQTARAELNALCDRGADISLKACFAAAELNP